MSHKYPGKLILFEGNEGSGKSTQIKILAAFLRKIGYDVVETKEPYGEYRNKLLDVNVEIKLNPEEELDLFLKNRAEHFDKLIISSLKEGKIILCDRSSPSTIAYQHYGRGLDMTDILVKDAKARQNVNFDLIFLLNIDPEIGLRRKKPETRFELEDIEFHRRVRQGYLEQAKNDLDKKWVVIDASLPFEAVKTKALSAIMTMLRREMKLA